MNKNEEKIIENDKSNINELNQSFENENKLEKCEITPPQDTQITKRKMTRTDRALLLCHGIYGVISLFVSTFLISYIYEISNNYVINIGLFYLGTYACMAVVNFVCSMIIDRTNRVSFYHIAIFVRAIFIIMVIFIGKDLAKYVFLAGLINGLTEGFYWSSYNIMKNELVSKHVFTKYSITQQFNAKFINIVVPLIMGALIDKQSFKLSAIVVLVISIVQLISALFIKSKKPENASFNFKQFIVETKNLGEKKTMMTQMMIISFLYGVVTIVTPLSTVLIMYTFGNSNTSLGTVKSVTAICSMILLILISRYTYTGRRKIYYILAATLPIISSLLLVIIPNRTFMVIFNITFAMCALLHTYTFDVHRNILIKKLKMYDSIAEYQASIELLMEIARVILFGLMVIAGVIGQKYGADGLLICVKILLPISVLGVTIIDFIMIKLEKDIKKFNIE